MFSRKSKTKIPIPTFANSSEKVDVGILVIDFEGNLFDEFGQVSKQIFLQFMTSLNSTTFHFRVTIKSK